MTYSEFTSKVRQLYSGEAVTDEAVAKHMALWVQAQYARIVGDLPAFNTFNSSFKSRKYSVAAYSGAATFSTLRDLAKNFLTETDPEAVFPETCSRYVKYHLLSEVDRDPKLSAAIEIGYRKDRLRLAGHQTQLTDSALRDKVREYLPVDKDRQGVQTYIDNLVLEAKEDIEGLGRWIEDELALAYQTFLGHKTWFDEQVQQSLLEMQQLIPELKSGNVNVYDFRNTLQVGKVSQGNLPDGAEVEKVRLEYPSKVSLSGCGLGYWPWRDREHLFNGLNCEPKFTVEPGGDEFWVHPALVSGFPEWENGKAYVQGNRVESAGTFYKASGDGTSSGTSPENDVGVTWEVHHVAPPVELFVFWTGSKIEYSDEDPVPFPELAANAVAHQVKYQAASEKGDVKQATIDLNRYKTARRLVNANVKARSKVRHPKALGKQTTEAFKPAILSITEGPVYAVVGEDVNLEVEVVANPSPTFTWEVS